MNRNKMVLLSLILGFGILLPNVFAQTSLTFTSTGSIFKTDVDYYMDVNDWSLVKMDKLFAYVLPANSGIRGGFSKYFGTNYLGLYYSGNIASGDYDHRETTVGSNPTTETPLTDDGMTWNNSFHFLYGNDSLGALKLNIALVNLKFDNDVFNGVVLPSSFTATKTKTGNISTRLVWGKNFEAGNGLLKPEISFGFIFDILSTETDIISVVNKINTVQKGENSFNAGIDLEYEFEKKGNHQSVLEGSYSLAKSFYPSYYKKTTAADNSVSTEDARIGTAPFSNNLTVQFKSMYDITDRFSVGYRARLSSQFSYSKSQEQETDLIAGTTTKNDPTVSFFTCSITPVLAAGTIYKIVPDRFNLNASVLANLPAYAHKNTKTETSATKTTQEDKENTWTGLTSHFNLGGTFFVTSCFSLDLQVATVVNTMNISSISLQATYKR